MIFRPPIMPWQLPPQKPSICPGCGRCKECGARDCKPHKDKYVPGDIKRIYKGENLGNKVQQAVDFINS